MTSDSRIAQFRALYRNLRLEDQYDYYAQRCAEYRSAHRRASIARNVLLLLAALPGLAARCSTGLPGPVSARSAPC